jgi:hypothetical protein
MPYVTGVVNSLPDLKTAIINAVTANGWAHASGIVSKGGVFVQIDDATSGQLRFFAGTSQSGSSLVNPTAQLVRMSAMNPGAITFPATFHVFIGTVPDEVYVVLNYGSEFYQWACWGQSTVALPGQGCWLAASVHHQSNTNVYLTALGNGNSGGAGECVPAPFWRTTATGTATQSIESYIHHGLDGRTWSNGDDSNNQPEALSPQSELVAVLPNDWNDETVLLPIDVFVPRTAGNKISLVASLKHARYCRVDFHQGGDIFDDGGSEWMIFPFYRKDSTARDGGSGIAHTGTLGWAIRYDGP